MRLVRCPHAMVDVASEGAADAGGRRREPIIHAPIRSSTLGG
jgi:hypothetical protein